ncbi:wHTH domain-containing protein [Streptomyces atroolivaceus]|uniref:wHTH domain-containing protein n=1 Tax=Streptomyces atroolivaceus TaxID=66869 RepID=UPI00362D4023
MGRIRQVTEVEHVLTVASRTGRSPAEVAASLSALGFGVRAAAYPARRPAPGRPRRP